MKKLSMILTVLIIFGTSAIGHTSDKCVVFEGTFERSTRRPVAHFEYSHPKSYFLLKIGTFFD